MTEIRQISRNTGFLALARVVERGSGLVLAIFIARSLGPSSFGVYAAAMAYYGLLAPAGELGIVNLLVREIARHRALTNRYLIHATVIAAVASVVAVVIFVFVVQHLGLSGELTLGISIVALALLPATLNSIQVAVFIAHQRVYFKTYVAAAVAIVNVGVGLYLLETGHGVVSVFTLFVALEYLATVVYFVMIGRRIVRVSWEWDWVFARHFLRDVRPFAGTSLVAAAFSRPEIIILSLVGTASQVGYYSAAFKVAALWNDMTQVFMANVFPVFSRLYSEAGEAFDALRAQVLRYLLAGSLPLAVGAAVTAGPVTMALYGDEFGPAVTPMRILALTVPLVSIQAVLWRVLSVRGQQGVVFRVQLISVAVRLAGGYLLIVVAGVNGAAISVAVAFAVHTALLAFHVNRQGVRIDLLKLAWPFAAASAAMGVVTWVVLKHADLWAAVTIAVSVYVLLLLPVALRSTDRFASLRTQGFRAATRPRR